MLDFRCCSHQALSSGQLSSVPLPDRRLTGKLAGKLCFGNHFPLGNLEPVRLIFAPTPTPTPTPALGQQAAHRRRAAAGLHTFSA